MNITFYIPDEANIDKFLNLDPDKDWKIFRKSQRWTVQTYLRLKKAGVDVHLSREIPNDGILVFHARHKRFLKKAIAKSKHLILVGIRGDKSEPLIADFQILQNGLYDNGRTKFFIPYWPQPDLLPRDSNRKNNVEVIAFKGFNINLHPYFNSDEWLLWINSQGLDWKMDSMHFPDSEESGVLVDWHDYRDVDIVLAFRPKTIRKDQKKGYTTKPATKLYNAWHAGVPAILPVEYAYRETRLSPLDYIEINHPDEAKEAILRLKFDPLFYKAMIDNGLERSREYSVDRITHKWSELLLQTIPERINSPWFRFSRRIPVPMRIFYRSFERKILFRPKR